MKTTPSAAPSSFRSLKNGELKELENLASLLGLNQYFQGEVELFGQDPILRSPHHLAESTAYALLCEAMAASSIRRLQTGKPNNLKINVEDAIHFLHSSHFLWQSGYATTVGAEFIPTNGIFSCRDGKHIMIESGPPYVKLERGYLNFFDCGNNRESLARAIQQYDGENLQEALSQQGLPACLAYTKEEWRGHPQGRELLKVPVIEIEKLADGTPVALTGPEKHNLGPLSSIKVLDFTHVLAGPRSARTLANLGAQVLHISSPYHSDSLAQNLLVNPGKHSAYLDLNVQENLAIMDELIKETDVFITSYRPSVNEKFGLRPQDLITKKDNIVTLSINAYGHSGPWSTRPGFDQNAQVATGFAVTEGEAQNKSPQFSPVFYLNDFLTGYLAASGVMSALLRRATEGGSYHVKVSLARTAMWVQDLGYIEKKDYQNARSKDDYPAKLTDQDSPFGIITELAPAVQYDYSPLVTALPVKPFGADKPKWWR